MLKGLAETMCVAVVVPTTSTSAPLPSVAASNVAITGSMISGAIPLLASCFGGVVGVGGVGGVLSSFVAAAATLVERAAAAAAAASGVGNGNSIIGKFAKGIEELPRALPGGVVGVGGVDGGDSLSVAAVPFALMDGGVDRVSASDLEAWLTGAAAACTSRTGSPFGAAFVAASPATPAATGAGVGTAGTAGSAGSAGSADR